MPATFTDDLDTSTFNLKDLLSPVALFGVASPEDALEHLLTNVQSSHEPVLVTDDDDQFRGILSMGEALYHKRTPYSTKAKRIMFMPPKLDENSHLFEIVKGMLATRIYALPILKEAQVIGLIEAVKLIQWLWTSKQNTAAIAATLTFRKPVTIDHRATIQEALDTFRKSERSRLLVTNQQQAVVGIINRSDLKFAYYTPPTRDRFTAYAHPRSRAVKDANELYRGDAPLARYYQPVQSEGLNTWGMDKIIGAFINSEFNYIVVMDAMRKPVGTVSTRNLLEAIARYA